MVKLDALTAERNGWRYSSNGKAAIHLSADRLHVSDQPNRVPNKTQKRNEQKLYTYHNICDQSWIPGTYAKRICLRKTKKFHIKK